MSFSMKRTVWLAFTGLAILGAMVAPAHAQRGTRQPMIKPPLITPYPVNPNGFTGAFPTAQQQLFNSRVVGCSIANIPPYAFGYNPYPSPIINTAPIISPPIYPTSPYATLSTSPYAATSPYGSTLSTSPYGGGYSLSTTGGYGGSGYGGYGGYGYGDPSSPYGGTLQGLASLTQAQGNYQIQIQTARLLREQARQANIDTARKQLQFEAWYESMKMTAPKMREIEAATELDRARKDPPAGEVWSGKSLNELLRSIRKAGRNNLKNGPQVDLSDVSLENVNLTDQSGQGNASLLKAEKDGKLALHWPAAFENPTFAKTAERLTQSLSEAVAAIKKKEKPAETTLKDVRNDYKTLSDKVAETASTDELSPSQYIEAKRYLRQLDQAIKALSSGPKASKYFDDWRAKGKTVAELVDHMMTNGLEFAPAASGDEAAYSALYQALRAYENGLQVAMTSREK
jgi:hypothetical protein